MTIPGVNRRNEGSAPDDRSSQPPSRSPGFVIHVGTYATGNIARRAVGFAMLPIYTRFLTPADYGAIGLLTFALALLEPLFGARLARAIPKFYFDSPDPLARRKVVWTALGLTGVVSLVTMLLVIAFRGIASDVLFGNRHYAAALGLFAGNFVTQPLEATGMTYIRLRERSKLFLSISMVKLALQVILNVLLVVYLRDGVVGVVVSGLISSTIVGILVSAYIAFHEAPAFDLKTTHQMLGYCWPLWLSGLAGLYMGSSGAVYLRVFDSLSDVGRLELALRFSAAVGMLIWAPFFQHWEPLSFQFYREPDGKRKFQVAFLVMSALLFSAGLGISIFSEPIIHAMASPAFFKAATVVPILTLGLLLNSLRSFFSFGFFASGSTKVHGVCQYLTAIVLSVAYFALVPAFGLIGAASAQCLSYGAGFILVWLISRRYFDPGINLIPLAKFTIIAGTAYLCAHYLFQHFGLTVELLFKSSVLLIAVGLMSFFGVREIAKMDSSLLACLPPPLCRLARLQSCVQPRT